VLHELLGHTADRRDRDPLVQLRYLLVVGVLPALDCLLAHADALGEILLVEVGVAARRANVRRVHARAGAL
jgi:hypothetical protein